MSKVELAFANYTTRGLSLVKEGMQIDVNEVCVGAEREREKGTSPPSS